MPTVTIRGFNKSRLPAVYRRLFSGDFINENRNCINKKSKYNNNDNH